jgi:purine-nucleoside phosphorylase
MLTAKNIQTNISEAKEFLENNIQAKPELGIILGSGLGELANYINDKIEIAYQEIPHFPISTVQGHSGKLVFGQLSSKYVMAFQGRFHYYEGYEMSEVTLPVRVMQSLGLKKMIVTNAAGGINENYRPGDLVIIKDHINLIGTNPLRGPNISNLGPRFSDMSEAYNREWRNIAGKVMEDMGIARREGVYAALCGPSYETPAEIKYLRSIGADLVGMSTVPEVIVANHGGMKVLGISCVTNMAAGILPQKLSHEEVIATTEKAKESFIEFINRVISYLD